MSLVIKPTATEFVEIEHRDWGARWSIQFPEAIESADGTIRAWPTIRPNWERLDDATWGYTWQPPADYAQQVDALKLATPEGRPQYSRFVAGAELRAEISAHDSELQLSLTITNTGRQPLREVSSDGGCFQARSETFRGGDEVARSYVISNGAMTSMAKLHRTVPIRCHYCAASTAFEWFWGRTEAAIDLPARVGMVSRDGQHAVVFGYEHACEAMQNADDHHCLHSWPSFGELLPGQSITRRGWILFGDDIHELAGELTNRVK